MNRILLKYLPLLLFPLLACSCVGVRVYHGGKPVFADYTDFDGTTEIHDGKWWFKRSGKQDASTIVTKTTGGATQIIGTLGLGAAAVAIPK